METLLATRDEENLLTTLAQGDDRALEELYGRFSSSLYGFGMRRLGTPGLAEELVQETFVRIWQKARSFDPTRGSAKTFLFTIARSVAVDLYRRPSSRPLELAREAHRPDHAGDVETAVVVREAMGTLSEAHRDVLELLFFEQHTQAEAAAERDLPLGTIKTRSHHALRAMRSALTGVGFEHAA